MDVLKFLCEDDWCCFLIHVISIFPSVAAQGLENETSGFSTHKSILESHQHDTILKAPCLEGHTQKETNKYTLDKYTFEIEV